MDGPVDSTFASTLDTGGGTHTGTSTFPPGWGADSFATAIEWSQGRKPVPSENAGMKIIIIIVVVIVVLLIFWWIISIYIGDSQAFSILAALSDPSQIIEPQ